MFNYIFCVKVSEVCFDRNMDDLLHTSTSTSCHFKIFLKSHTVTLLGQRLDESLLWRFWRLRRLCRRWNQGSLYNSLTFSEEAYGFCGLLVTSLFQILDQCDLTNYDIGFVQIRENEVKAAKDAPLGLNNHICAD